MKHSGKIISIGPDASKEYLKKQMDDTNEQMISAVKESKSLIMFFIEPDGITHRMLAKMANAKDLLNIAIQMPGRTEKMVIDTLEQAERAAIKEVE